MKRGDVVVVAMNTEVGKPCPALIVQSNIYLDQHPTVNVLPITSELRGHTRISDSRGTGRAE
ncbi:type II toxin-antitoxin system PemK/MazF family toxin [Cupriavidus plantarum]|uniref:type II toxin-antitoxin system PemK/MazF family toxin n=1 Tax=Cupriavidus plantarum TaxID=942865 RepID=UPI001BA450C6